MFSFRFRVEGRPASYQTNTPAIKDEWKARVLAAIEERSDKPKALIETPLRMTLLHFLEDPPESDTLSIPDWDNVVKTLRDFLEGVIYPNDRKVKAGYIAQLHINAQYSIVNTCPILLEGIRQGREFCYVKLDSWDGIGDLSQL